MTQSLTGRLHDAFGEFAERPCLRVPGADDWTYGEVAGLGARFAAVLRELGVTKGERLLVQVDKSPQAVALYLACLRTGAAYVPINTAYTSAEVEYFLNDAQPRLFVCCPADEAALEPVARKTAREIASEIAVLTLGSVGDGSLMARADAAQPSTEIATPAGSDIAAILYTSGTTGRSKGAMLTQENLLSNALTLLEYWGWRNDDVLLHTLPIFHVHGLFVALHCAFLSGTPVLFLPGFSADRVLASLPDASVMMGVPTFYSRLLDHPDFGADACRNMRLFISG